MTNPEKFLVFEKMAFEFVAGNPPYCDESTCHRQSMCYQIR